MKETVRTIRVECDHCGGVSLPMSDLTIRICVDTHEASYWFRCPMCWVRKAHDLHPKVLEVLLSHQARHGCMNIEEWYLPAEFRDPQRRDETPINGYDVRAFDLWVQSL